MWSKLGAKASGGLSGALDLGSFVMEGQRELRKI